MCLPKSRHDTPPTHSHRLASVPVVTDRLKQLDLTQIGQRYAAAVRAKLGRAESKSLADIVNEAIESEPTNTETPDNAQQQ